MKRFLRMIALVLTCVCCFSLFACGGGEKNKDVLYVTYQDVDSEMMLIKKVGDAFEQKMAKEGVNVKVGYKTVNISSYNSDMLKQWNSENLADVIYTYDNYASKWSKKGVFENLDDYFTSSNFDFTLYDEYAFNSAKTYNGSIYYAPRTYDQPVIYVNKDLFEKFNVEVPSAENFTWTKLMDVCAKLRAAMDKEANASVLRPLDVNFKWEPVYNAFVKSFGGYIYDAETDTIGFNDEGTVKAFEKIREMMDLNYIPATTGGGAGLFTSKKAAMYIMSRPSVSGLETRNMKNVAFLPMPEFDSEFTGMSDNESYWCYGTTGYAINSRSDKKELAWKFLQFVMSEEGQNIISATGANVPIIKSMQTDPNATWKTGINFLKDVDQSAFIFDSKKESVYTRILATYARTESSNDEYENTIYTNVGTIIGSFSQTYDSSKGKTVKEFCQYGYNTLATAIGK